MANRILAGNRSTGGYGLYVSKTGENVLDTTESLAFDSRAGNSTGIKTMGQGTTTSTAEIVHGLSYEPLFAVRWCTSAEITNNVATKVFDPRYQHMVSVTGGSEPDFSLTGYGCNAFHATNASNQKALRISSVAPNNSLTIYYSYIIFHEPDYTGGLGL
jgi:hypothetical protein